MFICSALKKENLDISNNMDDSGGHYTKSNKLLMWEKNTAWFRYKVYKIDS